MTIKPVKLTETVLKLVKEKEMILQRDAQIILNKYISSASQKLEEEGKIKRFKIKVRQPMGNLNDLWLLCVNNIDYNKVLDYEKKLVNKKFKSPLESHHFYKKGENPKNKFKNHETGEVTIITNNSKPKIESDKNDNVIDMAEYVKINNNELSVKSYNDVRIVTSSDISYLHQKEVNHVNEIFKRNRDKFVLNVDYFIITRDEFKIVKNDLGKLFTSNRQKEAYLFTETGYLLLTKPFTDDLSWTVQRELVNTYFKVKQLQKNETVSQLPEIQRLSEFDIMEMMIKKMKNQDERIENLENKLSNLSKVLGG